MKPGPDGPRGAPAAKRPRSVTVLGSTGSVGTQTIDLLLGAPPDRFQVTALVAGRNAGLLAEQAIALRAALTQAVGTDASAEVTAALTSLTATLDSVAGSEGGRGSRSGGAAPPPSFRSVNGALTGQLNAQDNADHAPNAPMLAAFAATCKELATVVAQWNRVVALDVTALNALLARHGRPAVPATAAGLAPPLKSSCGPRMW